MKSLGSLHIEQSYIALFGSGNSIHEITGEEFEFIRSKTFTVTINYAPVHLRGHINMWSDRRVSDFLEEYYREHPKETLFLAQKNKVTGDIKRQVDYWFCRREEQLKGNYTIVWALQLLKKYFPDKTILLFGVDMYADKGEEAKWYDKYTFFDKGKRGRRYDIHTKLGQCARQIRLYCPREGVFNCNLRSQLSHFEKRDWRSFFGLKILHLCTTPLAGAPAHLSRIINRYSNFESVSVLKSDLKGAGLHNLRWEYDVKKPSADKLRELVEWAGLIHHHRKIYPIPANAKAEVLQFHSPPNGYLPDKTHASFNGRKMVIAQYHPRFYTDAFIVPNLIDIWDPMYLPEKKAINTIKIFYSWATEVRGGWSDKGSAATRNILSRIKETYGEKVEIKVLHNRPYEECMAEKRTAHICIDECVTGSYHLQSLEGCSVGAVTFNNVDEQTLSYMAEVTGEVSHPFVKTNLEGLFEQLCLYIGRPEKLRTEGLAARKWMETHWGPQKLVQRYVRAYFDVFLHGKIGPGHPPAGLEAEIAPSRREPHPATPPRPARALRPRSAPPTPMVKKRQEAGRFSIQQLYKKYDGKDIYIFGTGPSLFKADPGEYKDEICFGINFAFEVMPHIDYHFAHVIEAYQAIRKVVDNRKLVLPETLVPQWFRERSKRRYSERVAPENEEAYCYPIQNPRERNLNRKHTSLQPEARIFTWSTTTHSAIHLAAYMGARRILLIGVDYQLFPNGQVHFDSIHYPEYGQQNWNANRKHRQGDEWLTKALGSSGVTVENLSAELLKKPLDQKPA